MSGTKITITTRTCNECGSIVHKRTESDGIRFDDYYYCDRCDSLKFEDDFTEVEVEYVDGMWV